MNKKCLVLSSTVPAFRDVIDVPLVVRRLHKSRSEVCFILLESVTLESNPYCWFLTSTVFISQVRKELGIADDVKVVIFNFGGQVGH